MIIKQFFIVLGALFLGYVISSFGLPVPANVLGFLILFVLMLAGVVKVKHVDKISDFIIAYLSVFFVVPSVGIMLYLDMLSSQFVKILIPLMVSIVIGYFVAAKVTEICINQSEKRKAKGKKKGMGGMLHE